MVVSIYLAYYKKPQKQNLMKNLFYIIVILFLVPSCGHSQQYASYNYEIYGFKEIYTEGPIYLDSTKIGSLTTINYDSTFQKCYGKLRIDKNVKIYSNMVFVHLKPVIGFPFVTITIKDSIPKRLLYPDKDTIVLLSKIE
jgi:hypothetical protein